MCRKHCSWKLRLRVWFRCEHQQEKHLKTTMVASLEISLAAAVASVISGLQSLFH